MIVRFRKDGARRRAEKIRFYFRAIGLHIRKRRKELHLTQETLAKGICSNTYVSKMETNSIAVNEDSLSMIMERMNMEYTLEMNVDEQIRLFDRALEAFIAGDADALARVYYEVRNVDFGVLTELCRLAHHVLREDEKEITRISDELSRFLDSMDHFTFGVCMLYTAAGMIINGQPGNGIKLLEELDRTEFSFLKLAPIADYYKFIGYGRIRCYGKAYVAAQMAEAAYTRSGNYARLAEINLYRLEFETLQGTRIASEWNQGMAGLLRPAFIERYHLIRALAGIDPPTEVASIRPGSYRYAIGQFFKGRYLLVKGDRESFLACCDALKTEPRQAIDFATWLTLLGAGDQLALKEFLIDQILPFAEATSNIYLLEKTTETVVGILESRKRYKDAIAYTQKMMRIIRRITGIEEQEEETTDEIPSDPGEEPEGSESE
ncbi:MAG: helix-turn-helix transcriptional regulator [bacterium]